MSAAASMAGDGEVRRAASARSNSTHGFLASRVPAAAIRARSGSLTAERPGRQQVGEDQLRQVGVVGEGHERVMLPLQRRLADAGQHRAAYSTSGMPAAARVSRPNGWPKARSPSGEEGIGEGDPGAEAVRPTRTIVARRQSRLGVRTGRGWAGQLSPAIGAGAPSIHRGPGPAPPGVVSDVAGRGGERDLVSRTAGQRHADAEGATPGGRARASRVGLSPSSSAVAGHVGSARRSACGPVDRHLGASGLLGLFPHRSQAPADVEEVVVALVDGPAGGEAGRCAPGRAGCRPGPIRRSGRPRMVAARLSALAASSSTTASGSSSL